MSYNTFDNINNISPKEFIPGFTGRIIHTDQVSISFFEIKKGSSLPEHAHHHEQTSYVIEGSFEFTLDGEKRIVGPGDYVCISPNTPHAGTALSDCRIMDVFSPVREEYK